MFVEQQQSDREDTGKEDPAKSCDLPDSEQHDNGD
jgi:hypothetical protein